MPRARVRLRCCLTAFEPRSVRKFGMGTPAEVQRTLERCWEVAPTGDQIVEDILGLPRVLQKMIDNKGAALLDEFYRSGRREMSMTGERLLKSRPRAHGRITTMTAYAVHPSVAHVPDLYKPDPVVVQQAVDEYEEADADGEPEDDVLIA